MDQLFRALPLRLRTSHPTDGILIPKTRCVQPGDSGGFDRQSAPPAPLGLADHDLHVPAERHQETQQPLDGAVAEMGPQQARHVGLGEAEQVRGLGLGQPASANDLVDPGHDLRLQEVGIGVGAAEAGEHVAPTALGLHVVGVQGFIPASG